MCEVASVYCDGGVIGKNPSPIGGTCAFCWVNGQGDRIASGYGSITPSELDLPTVSNNVTELLAATMSLEMLPEGWAGTLYTDSFITLRRVIGFQAGQKPAKMNGVPQWLQDRTRAAVERLGAFKAVLLGGHPNEAELAAGFRKDGFPVSPHNVWCDWACGQEAEKVKAKLAVAA